jgi:hypothetical protein
MVCAGIDGKSRRIPSLKMLLGWAAMRNKPVAMVVYLQRKTHLNFPHLFSTGSFEFLSTTLAMTMTAPDTNDNMQPGLLAQLARPSFVGLGPRLQSSKAPHFVTMSLQSRTMCSEPSKGSKCKRYDGHDDGIIDSVALAIFASIKSYRWMYF